jgi:hypothetical protein
VIVTIPGIPELQNVKAIVLETGLMTTASTDVYIRIRPLISSPNFTTVKTKQSYVVHDLETVQQLPSQQSKSSNSTPPSTSNKLKRRASQAQPGKAPSTPTKQSTIAPTRASTRLATAKVATTTTLAIPIESQLSAVPRCDAASKPFQTNDHVIVTIPEIPELQNVKAIVLETGLMTTTSTDVYIRIRPLISSPNFTTVKTKQSYVVHDLETVQQLPSQQSKSSNSTPPSTSKKLKRRASQAQPGKAPSTPTKQSTIAPTRASTRLAPPPKRRRVSLRRPAPSTSMCDFGDVPSITGSSKASALLVPFIHAVTNKVSNITNEIAAGRRGGSRPSEFRFNYSEFAIRNPENEAEFDYLVDIYAAEYVANGITRASVYTRFCNSMGYIGADNQERLTDPFHKRSLVPDIDKDIFGRLFALR